MEQQQLVAAEQQHWQRTLSKVAAIQSPESTAGILMMLDLRLPF
jgi:hypothetical protein